MTAYEVRKASMPLARKIILALSREKVLDEKKLQVIRNRITKETKGTLPKNIELIEAYLKLAEEGKIKPNPNLLRLIQKRKVRTLSGIANITVLTKDWGCPGECIFCPTEKGMPKSYLSSEPAMMRAVMNQFDAYKQVKARLNGLTAQGHDVSKIDIRIAGGTWSAIPHKYQTDFIAGVYRALNEGPGRLRAKQQVAPDTLIKKNETAKWRCVGLWIETRPDWVTPEEIKRWREFGITGVELGVQTTDDKVNAYCKRGHGLKESIAATKLCRDAGLKVCHHLMPNLPKANIRSDLKSGRELFELEGLRPDYLKIYPCVVTPMSKLGKMVTENPKVHKPYSDKQLIKLIAAIKKFVPEYCRIIRIIRDIPADEIMLGCKKSNLRQEMQKLGVACRCIRCREIQENVIRETRFVIREYNANGGKEYFLSIEEPNLDKIIALCRLRLHKGDAIIRELHVYGRTQSLSAKPSIRSKSQHHGFGKQLMAEAEKIAKKAGYKKIAVIAAVGTREYYKKLGYRLEGTYMVNTL